MSDTKRITVLLDQHLLDEAKRALGATSYSAAVNLALAEVVRVKNLRQLRQEFGKCSWQGSLSEMRGDQTKRKLMGRKAVRR